MSMYRPDKILIALLFSFTISASSAQKSTAPPPFAATAKSVTDYYGKYIDENRDRHLKEFVELVSIPSISSIPAHHADVIKAADWIVAKLKAIGMPTAEALPTSGNPVVFASWLNAPGKPTVLIYGHYDVQPVNEKEWTTPPFSPVARDGKVYGRGASDDKSGVMTSIWAVEAMLKKDGKLPVNLKFMFEGNEEVGSPGFKTFLENNKKELKADFALNADDGQYNDNTPAITISLRGSVAMEFSVKTADIDGHSGEFGGKTPNAAVDMAQIITSFFDENGNVAVKGFYDKVKPITARQKEMIKKIPYDPATDRKILGTTAEVGDTSYSPLERVWYRPTLEIVGMQSGYTGEGHSNIVPGHATTKITCRLVDNQNGDEIVQLIEKHIEKHCPPGAKITYKVSPGFASPMNLPA